VKLAESDHNLEIVYPVHLNPNIQLPVKKYLSEYSNIHLIEPLEYLHFTYLMMLSTIILTDSGGIQEEAPSLGKPVLLMRENTERPEAVEAGTVKLVGTSTLKILSSTLELLQNKDSYEAMSNLINPYGLGDASSQIIKRIEMYYDI
jgi:UDP-N-acetylglucosamine 2-epimerase (non-hydrolysing)